MASQPLGPGPHPAQYGLQSGVPSGIPAYGQANPTTCNRSYLMAGVRAGVIALGLLVLFTLLILL